LTSNECLFCNLPNSRVIARSTYGIVIRDEFPVSPGHTLVIPHRHIASFFELTNQERLDLFALLDVAKVGVDTEFLPQGYNIAINDGLAAGHTVHHLHIQLIPRYTGGHAAPRGGMPAPSNLKRRRILLSATPETMANGIGLSLAQVLEIEDGKASKISLDNYAKWLETMEAWPAEKLLGELLRASQEGGRFQP
jgi:diadenosine tetraphosphate (Ap4A) HIT family hydrolase